MKQEEKQYSLEQLSCDEYTLSGLFEKQVRRFPQASAVVYKGKSMSYQELDGLANRVKVFLHQSWHVKPNEPVGLMVDKSERMLIGMLGILKSGGAYVPIDPNYPTYQVDYLLKDAQISKLLLDADHISKIKNYAGKFCLLDIDLESLSEEGEDQIPTVQADRLAYIIYTSGTTGKRKGVAVKHQSIINTLRWRKDYYNFSPSDVTLQLPSFSFDSSVVDIFTTLLAGGKLVLPEENLKIHPVYFQRMLSTYEVTNFLITPTFYQYIQGFLDADIPSLRFVTVAGENVTKQIVDTHYQVFPHVNLVNEYGPTENSVCSTVKLLKKNELTITIGKPIDHVQVFLLDDDLNEVENGEKGEIFLGGDNLSVGYYNNISLTEEKFIHHPSKAIRLYRTGDFARWLENGELEFLGRRDRQVKIRGFRIEIPEIENHLLEHPAVKDAAIIVHGDHEEKELVAFCVLNHPIETTAIFDFLKKRLPVFMIPASILTLENLPMNQHGKLNYEALQQQLKAGRASPEAVLIAPGNEIEETLLKIWQKALKRNNIGIKDNFFELGGNSLNVIDVVAKVYEELEVVLSTPDMYNYPDIEKLSKFIMMTHKSF